MNIKFYDGRCTKPATSGDYLVMMKTGDFHSLEFSARKNMWGTHDDSTRVPQVDWDANILAWAENVTVDEMEDEVF